MTHPTTEPNIRERLARALYEHDLLVLRNNGFPRHDIWDSAERRASYVAQVDAILAELQQPSDGMCERGAECGLAGQHFGAITVGARDDCRDLWRAMVAYILDGGQ